MAAFVMNLIAVRSLGLLHFGLSALSLLPTLLSVIRTP